MRGRVYAKIGLVLIVTSCGLWAAVLVVPILPFSVAEKALTATSLLVISEVFFWLGILLAGKEFAHNYRQKLNPLNWWRKITTRR
jgi:glucose-6-phosphate-specific signal transduction histidine kinase